MSVQLVAQTIQLILAPVVLVTSIAIMVSGMLQLYSNTNDRLRTLARERLQLLRTPEGAIARLDDKLDAFTTERLSEIDRQMPQLIRRHTLIHNAVLAEYAAILVLVISMIIIAISAATRSGPVATAALILFLIATVTMLAGVVLFAYVIRISNGAVSYEAQRVLMLGK
jgi:cytochrome bd-type quinol oxidase subunit 2